jgi:hypothetical protein
MQRHKTVFFCFFGSVETSLLVVTRPCQVFLSGGKSSNPYGLRTGELERLYYITAAFCCVHPAKQRFVKRSRAKSAAAAKGFPCPLPVNMIEFFFVKRIWRDDRAAYGACLENRCGETHRGFESLSLRRGKNSGLPEFLPVK